MKQHIPFVFLSMVAVLFLLAAQPARCQTARTTKTQQKREMRTSLKEAQEIETDFNESHLNLGSYNLKKGESGRKLKKVKKKEEMPINEEGAAAAKPKTPSKKNAPARPRRK